MAHRPSVQACRSEAGLVAVAVVQYLARPGKLVEVLTQHQRNGRELQRVPPGDKAVGPSSRDRAANHLLSRHRSQPGIVIRKKLTNMLKGGGELKRFRHQPHLFVANHKHRYRIIQEFAQGRFPARRSRSARDCDKRVAAPQTVTGTAAVALPNAGTGRVYSRPDGAGLEILSQWEQSIA